jgi:hypothetical protein
MIQAHNAIKNVKYTLYPYEMFLFLTEQEIADTYLMSPDVLEPFAAEIELSARPGGDAAVNAHPNVELDWSRIGADGSVKSQGKCGSCYVFSAAASIHHASLKATGTGTDISHQQIVDCSMDERFRKYRNNGCKGGWPHYVFSHVKEHHISPFHHYPYHPDTAKQGVHGACRTNNDRMLNFRIVNLEVASNAGLDQLIKKLHVNVLSIGVASNNRDFLFYKGGVLTKCGAADARIDHAVALVGVRVHAGIDVAEWKVKNSWGTKWGENGYIRIDMHHNICKVRSYYSFPIVQAM